MSKISFGLLLCFMSVSAMAGAGIYKWTDPSGKVYFSDRPPEGSVKSLEKVKSASPAPAADEKDKKAAPTKAVEKSKGEDEKKVASAAAAEEKRVNDCKRAQESVRVFESGKRIGSVNEKGESVVLDKDEIAVRAGEAKKIADELCAPPAAAK